MSGSRQEFLNSMSLEQLKLERQRVRETIVDLRDKAERSRARALEIDDMDQSDTPDDFRLDSGFTWAYVDRSETGCREAEAELREVEAVANQRLRSQ